jgi:hypothetical protein
MFVYMNIYMILYAIYQFVKLVGSYEPRFTILWTLLNHLNSDYLDLISIDNNIY